MTSLLGARLTILVGGLASSKLKPAFGDGREAISDLLLGVIHLLDLATVRNTTGNAAFTLVGLNVIGLMLVEAGIFRFLVLRIAR